MSTEDEQPGEGAPEEDEGLLWLGEHPQLDPAFRVPTHLRISQDNYGRVFVHDPDLDDDQLPPDSAFGESTPTGERQFGDVGRGKSAWFAKLAQESAERVARNNPWSTAAPTNDERNGQNTEER